MNIALGIAYIRQYIAYLPLECCAWIFQSESLNLKLIRSEFAYDGCFLLHV